MKVVISEFNSILECLKERYGESTAIVDKSYVGGGDINQARCLKLSNGEIVFMKSNTISNADFFRAEASGVMAIESTEAIKTPKLLGRGIDREQGGSFLIMEFVSGTGKVTDFWETFGHELAEMHLAETADFTGGNVFGFSEDNFIGATEQINAGRKGWITFYRECRLEPQFKMASRYFDSGMKRNIERLLDRLPVYLDEPAQPSLLHGDLWSGNYIVGNDGKAWLIDPAVYVGHAEADLAMTELFGRFPERFYKAYSEVNPIDPNYKDRRDLYNLYHLTNHLNLFGSTYLSAVIETVNHYQ